MNIMSTPIPPESTAGSLKSDESPTTSTCRETSKTNEMPEWIRLPRPGEHEQRTGLTRSVIGRLCAEGKVKSITLRERNKVRGCRLVSLPSLLAYLRHLDAAQNTQPEGAE